jgi:hypothetical protein
MNETELVRKAKRLNLPLLGVYLNNQLGGLTIGESGLTFYNLDHTHSGSVGTHWTASVANGKDCLYFDSFGFPPTVEIEQFIKTRFPVYHYNKKEIQDYYSEKCGTYCLLFGYEMNKGGRLDVLFNKFIKLFTDNTLHNEQVLNRFHVYFSLLEIL